MKLQKGPFDRFVLKLCGLQVKELSATNIRFLFANKKSNIKAGAMHFFFQITLRICLLLAFSSVTHRFCLIPQSTISIDAKLRGHEFGSRSQFSNIKFIKAYSL